MFHRLGQDHPRQHMGLRQSNASGCFPLPGIHRADPGPDDLCNIRRAVYHQSDENARKIRQRNRKQLWQTDPKEIQLEQNRCTPQNLGIRLGQCMGWAKPAHLQQRYQDPKAVPNATVAAARYKGPSQAL